MKIREGFISNSSSTSFLIGLKSNEEDLDKLYLSNFEKLRKLGKEPDDNMDITYYTFEDYDDMSWNNYTAKKLTDERLEYIHSFSINYGSDDSSDTINKLIKVINSKFNIDLAMINMDE